MKAFFFFYEHIMLNRKYSEKRLKLINSSKRDITDDDIYIEHNYYQCTVCLLWMFMHVYRIYIYVYIDFLLIVIIFKLM